MAGQLPEEEFDNGKSGYSCGMRDRELYARILGLVDPWGVTEVELRPEEREVLVFVARSVDSEARCPRCQAVCPGYDTNERRWRHLDTCQYRTILVGQIPRIECKEHGVQQVAVPWAEPGSRFTALFESLVIDWLHEASFSAVARQLQLSWAQVDRIQARAVLRGLVRRNPKALKAIGVDETSSRRGHNYLTIVSDAEAQTVEYVAEGRSREEIDRFYKGLGTEGCASIESVAMDMWQPYIESTRAHVPEADAKIVFDKFHIAKHLGDAVDKTRRKENRELIAANDDRLKGTKYHWLRNSANMTREERRDFAALRDSSLRTARAWAIRDAAMKLWGYTRRGWAERMWKKWLSWAHRSKLEPIKRVARMIVSHWDGVMNAVLTGRTNAGAEGLNAKIQKLKKDACGYRNIRRFIRAIYFRLGGLDLYPNTAEIAHSKV